jgi:2-dehydropantoate 2-reductase
MNFLVVGPGAMGCLFAVRLARAGHGVTLLDYREDRARLLREQGLRLEGVSGDHRVVVPVQTGPLAYPLDLALICVKAGRTREAAQGLARWLPHGTRLLTLQNGLGNLETLVDVFGEDRVLGGVTAEGATLLGVGHVRHAGRGETVIGPSGRAADSISGILSAFDAAGFHIKAVSSVTELIWGKLIVNVGINALTAITGVRNGQIPKIQGTRALMAEAVEEAVAVARAKGIRLPYPDPLARVIEVCEATGPNIASMLQDVLNERGTEVKYINGAIVREGAALGISSPVNRTLAHLVGAIEESYGERVRHP